MAFPSTPDNYDNLYRAKNFVATVLSAPVAIADTTITVVDATDFPDPTTEGRYILVINDGLVQELLLVTGKTGNVLNVARGFDGTVAGTFSINAAVILVVAAAYHNVLVDAIAATQTEVIQNTSDISTHTSDTGNPHSTNIGNIGSGTLAELNAAVTDATLDDASDPRTPTAHTHVESDITDLDKYTQAETDSLLDNKISLLPTGGNGNLTVIDALGDIEDSGISATDVSNAVGSTHTQNTDTELDSGGANATTAADIRNHLDSTANPHGVTKAQVGLSNVPNIDATDADNVVYDGTTSGLISTDVQAAIDEIVVNIQNGLAALGTDDIANDSTVTGTTATDALNDLGTRTTTNDAKVSADGSVLTHSDVTGVGSGSIITSAERSKLAGLESSKFLGNYTTLLALQTAHPSPATGSYGDVDAGVGTLVERYIWDSDDNVYVKQQGESTAETPTSIKTKYESNPNTNAFTDAEQTKLGGIETGAQVNTVDSVNGDTGVVSLDTGDIPENGNLYYTETRVSANTDVTNNTAKVSADGSATTHSDITDAGSGAIITAAERAALGNSFDKTSDTLDDVLDGTSFKKVTSDEKGAMAGTSGTPSDTNRYVTDSDSRLSTLTAHATTHESGGTDVITGTNIAFSSTPTNYTPLPAATLGGHLVGIDTAIGTRITDAANDGVTYARQNEGWVSIQGPLSQAHLQNSDTSLDSGGANAVLASEIRTHIDGDLTQHGVPAYPNDGNRYYLVEQSNVLTWELDMDTTVRIAEVYQTATTTTLLAAGTYVGIVFDTIRIVGSSYTYNVATGEFTTTEAGWYELEYSISLQKATGNARATSAGRLTLNSAPINGSYSYSYHRNLASGEGTLHGKIILNMGIGNTVGVQAALLNGTGTLSTITGTNSGCNFTLKRIA